MSVRNALLALVAQQPAGVYRLKQMFEEQTCGAWPLNIGQVYQTMQRLERDGQVVSHAETNAGRDSEVFELTELGREVLDAWWATPVPRENPERDELVITTAEGDGREGQEVRFDTVTGALSLWMRRGRRVHHAQIV